MGYRGYIRTVFLFEKEINYQMFQLK